MSDEPEDLEDGIVVTQALQELDPATIKRASPKRYIAVVTGAGFEVRAATTRTFERGTVFKSGEKTGQRRSDKEVEWLWIIARAGQVAKFKLCFAGGSFDHGWVWDAAGWPVEPWADYSPSADALRQRKDEPDWAWQQRVAEIQQRAREMDAEYNDGTVYIKRDLRLVNASGQFEEWLADLVPGFEPRKTAAKKKDQSEATAVDLIEMGEWTG